MVSITGPRGLHSEDPVPSLRKVELFPLMTLRGPEDRCLGANWCDRATLPPQPLGSSAWCSVLTSPPAPVVGKDGACSRALSHLTSCSKPQACFQCVHVHMASSDLAALAWLQQKMSGYSQLCTSAIRLACRVCHTIRFYLKIPFMALIPSERHF